MNAASQNISRIVVTCSVAKCVSAGLLRTSGAIANMTVKHDIQLN